MTTRGTPPAAGTEHHTPAGAALIAIRSPNEGASGRTDRRRQRRYASALIVSTLLLAAGWELLRWIVLVVTLD